MKTTLSILAMFVFALSSFGQTRKSVKPAPRNPIRPVATKTDLYASPVVARNTPTRKIYVQKNDGSELIGLFVGGDAGSITVQVSDQNQVVRLDEIRSVIFTEGVATRIGTDSRLQTENTMDFKGTGIMPTEFSDYKGTGVVPTDSANLRTISGGVLNRRAVSLAKPEYPAAARAVRASGAVNVQVMIGGDGSILNASAVSGHPLLREAAENAARAPKFATTILQGEPVRLTGIIVYNFVP